MVAFDLLVPVHMELMLVVIQPPVVVVVVVTFVSFAQIWWVALELFVVPLKSLAAAAVALLVGSSCAIVLLLNSFVPNVESVAEFVVAPAHNFAFV